MPLVFRVMKKDEDDLPTVGDGSTSLGVRHGADVDTDTAGAVILDGRGMSVNRSWRDVFVGRIPRRLRHLVAGANGSNATFCFRLGDGPFQRGAVADGLELIPDTATHGNVAPTTPVPLADFGAALTATRASWQIDES